MTINYWNTVSVKKCLSWLFLLKFYITYINYLIIIDWHHWNNILNAAIYTISFTDQQYVYPTVYLYNVGAYSRVEFQVIIQQCTDGIINRWNNTLSDIRRIRLQLPYNRSECIRIQWFREYPLANYYVNDFWNDMQNAKIMDFDKQIWISHRRIFRRIEILIEIIQEFVEMFLEGFIRKK